MRESRTATPSHGLDLFAPTNEHRLLADTMHTFVRDEVEPQAAQFNREERFNRALFRRAGELGLLGLTVPERAGRRRDGRRRGGHRARGAVHRRPGLLPRLPRARDALREQLLRATPAPRSAARVLPKVVSGEWIGGMCMTEPDAGTDVLGMRTTRACATATTTCSTDARSSSPTAPSTTARLGDVFLVYAKTDSEASARSSWRTDSRASRSGSSSRTSSACAPR